MAVSLAAWKSYEKLGGPAPDFVAGHSLGEITALVAAGSLSLEDAVRLIDKRARLMEECPKGAMAAVLKVAPNVLEDVVASIRNARLDEGKSADEACLVVANLNTREQLVISGNPDAVTEGTKKAKEAGGKAIPLPVGGAFHSPLMTQAALEFETELNKAELKDARCEVVQNFDAKGTRSASEIKTKLAKQMESPVRWYETVEYMTANGVDTIIEIGPGTVLTGLVKKINPAIKVVNIHDSESLKAAIEALKHPVAS
jgi:[acyl-carrier-protein] S-malonyltransferase